MTLTAAGEKLRESIREPFDSLAPDFRWVVAAAPPYLERFGAPSHPDELQHHCGVGIRIGDHRVYRWEFEHGEEKIAVDVPGSLLVDQGHVASPAVKQGAALMYVPDFMVTQSIKAGVLTTVLDEWAAAGPAFHIYYSSRRQVPARLQLFIELVREMRPLG